MKPSTYTETLEIVAAYLAGTLKAWAVVHCMTYVCARKRLSRFRRTHSDEYKRLSQNVTLY